MPSSGVVSLGLQVIMFLLGKIELYKHEALIALPTMLRKKLLKHLPLADILLLERNEVTHDINMDEVWREILLERLGKLIASSKVLQQMVDTNVGSWRHLYLSILWDEVFCKDRQDAWEKGSNRSPPIIIARGKINVIEVDCNETVLLDSFFGVAIETLSSHKMYSVFCPSFKIDRTVIPQRYLLHYINKSNKDFFLYFLSIFWTYARFHPNNITLYKCACADVHGLADKVIQKYPKILSVPLEKVRTLNFVPIYTNGTELNLITSLLLCVRKSLQVIKITIKPDYPGQIIPIERFPSNVYDLTIVGGNNRQGNFCDFLERIISHYSNKLKKLTFDAVPLSCYTNEICIMSICGLFSRKKFRKLSLCDAELSVEIMNQLIEALLSSKYEQELELVSMRIFQFTENASMLSVGREAINTRLKSLTLINMLQDGFGMHIFDALKALPLRRLTVTVDMAKMLCVCDTIPVQELVLKLDNVDLKFSRFIKHLLIKSGFEEVTIEIPLDDWINQIHLTQQKLAQELFNMVVSVVELAATDGRLKKVTFYSKNDESKMLGSNNPLSFPEGSISLIFNKIFSLSSLHRLTIDLSNFNMTIAFVQCLVKAWSTKAEGERVACIVVKMTRDFCHNVGDLKVMCQVLEFNQ